MIRLFYYTTMIVLLGLYACKTQEALLLSPVKETIQIDGNLADWKDNAAKQGASPDDIIAYASQDDQYLYLGMRIEQEPVQALIMQQGLTISFDTLGKHKQHKGIGYPLSLTDDQWMQVEREGQNDLMKIKASYAMLCQEFDLLGIEADGEPLRASNLTSAEIKVGTRFDDVQNMYCELKIPFSYIYDGYVPNTKTLGIRLQVNEPPRTVDDDFGDANSTEITQANPLMGGAMGNGAMSPYSNRQQSMARPKGNVMPTLWFAVVLNAE